MDGQDNRIQEEGNQGTEGRDQEIEERGTEMKILFLWCKVVGHKQPPVFDGGSYIRWKCMRCGRWKAFN